LFSICAIIALHQAQIPAYFVVDEKWKAKDNWSDQKASFVAEDGQGEIQCAKIFAKDAITATAMPALTVAELEKVEQTSAKEIEKEAGVAATPNGKNSTSSLAQGSPGSESDAPTPAQGAEAGLSPPIVKRKRRCVRSGVA
jgi:hypothetical protein